MSERQPLVAANWKMNGTLGKPAPAGTVYEVLFDQAFLDANPQPDGVYDYYCDPHVAFGMVGTVEVSLPCLADLSGDDDVGPADLAMLLASWGPYEPCPPFVPADLNQDCDVGPADLAQLLASWGPCP